MPADPTRRAKNQQLPAESGLLVPVDLHGLGHVPHERPFTGSLKRHLRLASVSAGAAVLASLLSLLLVSS